MYHVSAQGIDERMINVHYYYYYQSKFGLKRIISSRNIRLEDINTNNRNSHFDYMSPDCDLDHNT